MRTSLVLLALSCSLFFGACAGQGVYPAFPHIESAEARDCRLGPDPVTLCGDQVPIYETVTEPIFETRQTPRYGHKTVDVYRTRRVPVTFPRTDPCTGCVTDVCLWHKSEKVQVGTRRVPACIGYKTERVQVGTCRKQKLVGWKVMQPAPTVCAPVACPPAVPAAPRCP